MRRFPQSLGNAVLIAGAIAGAAFGQGYPQYSQPQYSRPPYGRYLGQSDAVRSDRALFDRARMDLDRASSYQYASRADRKRFDEARRELFDFESRFDQGRYERHELDEAISRLQRVVEHNSLDPRDRGALGEDLRRMRDFREFRSHNQGGGYAWR
jgi:hypothetical protein